MRANLDVLGVLEVLDAKGRPADEGERQVLARWSGWGAVPGVFDETDARWSAERAELRARLGTTGMARRPRARSTPTTPIWRSSRRCGTR